MTKDTETKIVAALARLEANQDSMQKQIDQIHEQDKEQNKLLAEHIAGVKSAHKRIDMEKELLEKHEIESQKRYEVMDKRLDNMELFPNTLRAIGTTAKWITVVGGAAVIIAKALGMF